jgi:hypothetical protein
MPIDPAILIAFAGRLQRADAAIDAAAAAEASTLGLDPSALSQALLERAMPLEDRRRCQQHLDAYRIALGLVTWAQFVEQTIHEEAA